MLKTLNQQNDSNGDAAIDLKLSLQEQLEAENSLNEMSAVLEKQPVSESNFNIPDAAKDDPEAKLLISSILSVIENGSEQQIETVLQNAVTNITAKAAKDKVQAKKQADYLDEIAAVLEASHSKKFQPVLSNAAKQYKQIAVAIKISDLNVVREISASQQFKLNALPINENTRSPDATKQIYRPEIIQSKIRQDKPNPQLINETVRNLEPSKQAKIELPQFDNRQNKSSPQSADAKVQKLETSRQPRFDLSPSTIRQDAVRNMQLESQQGIKVNLVDALVKTKEVHTKLQTKALQERNPIIRENYKQAANELSRQGKLIGEVAVQSASVKQLMQEQVGMSLQHVADFNKQQFRGLDATSQKTLHERDASLKVAKQQHVELQSLVRNNLQQPTELSSKQANTPTQPEANFKSHDIKKDNIVPLDLKPTKSHGFGRHVNSNEIQSKPRQTNNDQLINEAIKIPVPIVPIKNGPINNLRSVDRPKESHKTFGSPGQEFVSNDTPRQPIDIQKYIPSNMVPKNKLGSPEVIGCRPGCGCPNHKLNTTATSFVKPQDNAHETKKSRPEYVATETPATSPTSPEVTGCKPGCGCSNHKPNTMATGFVKPQDNARGIKKLSFEYAATETPITSSVSPEVTGCKPGCGCPGHKPNTMATGFIKPETAVGTKLGTPTFVRPYKFPNTVELTRTDFKTDKITTLNHNQQQFIGS